LGSTRRAIGRGHIDFLAAIAPFLEGGDDVRDDFASPFHQNPVAYSQIFVCNEVKIMERGLLYDHSANAYRFQNSQGSQHTSPTNIYLDIEQGGLHLLAGILVGK